MAKFCGVIGFVWIEEEPEKSGIWVEKSLERKYYGNLTKNYKKTETGSQVNDDINISNQLTIVSDPYASDNFHMIGYVKFMGVKWKVTSVEVQYPRLILSLGGVYNGTSA